MRIIISFFLLASAFLSFSQRVSFEDPDLTFSFKKPKNWQMIDNGYEVKVYPSAKDSSSTYFTITYFEDAKPSGEFNLGQHEEALKSARPLNFKIAGVPAKYASRNDKERIITRYQFYKFGQRFELKTSFSETNKSKNERVFKRMIRSVKVFK